MTTVGCTIRGYGAPFSITQMSFKSVLCHEKRQQDRFMRVFEHLDLSTGSHFLAPIA